MKRLAVELIHEQVPIKKERNSRHRREHEKGCGGLPVCGICASPLEGSEAQGAVGVYTSFSFIRLHRLTGLPFSEATKRHAALDS